MHLYLNDLMSVNICLSQRWLLMKNQKLTVTLMCVGLAAIFSVGVGFAAYVFTGGPSSASGNAAINIGYYDYLNHIHPMDGGLYYTNGSNETIEYRANSSSSKYFGLWGQTTNSDGAITGCSLNNDGIVNGTRSFNSITVNSIVNNITYSDGTTVHAQKLVLPTRFIDEQDGTIYYVTRYDPQPEQSKTDPYSLFPNVKKPNYIDTSGGNNITEIDFATNDKLYYIGTRAFAYLHNLKKVNLASCTNLKIIDEWALCRDESIDDLQLPALSSAGAQAYKNAHNSYNGNAGFMGAFYKGAFHYDNAFDTVDFRAQRGLTTLYNAMFRDCNGVKNLVLSSNLTKLEELSFACYFTNDVSGIPANRRIFYEGNYASLKALISASSANWIKNQNLWTTFDHKIHCLIAETNGSYYACSITSNTNQNPSFSYAVDTSGEQTNCPTDVVTNRLFYKAA